MNKKSSEVAIGLSYIFLIICVGLAISAMWFFYQGNFLRGVGSFVSCAIAMWLAKVFDLTKIKLEAEGK